MTNSRTPRTATSVTSWRYRLLLVGGQGLTVKLVRSPNRAGIPLRCRFEDRYTPNFLAVGDRPIKRGRPSITANARMHD